MATTTGSTQESIFSPTTNRFKPSSAKASSSSPAEAADPDLVILSPWSDASLEQLNRYIHGYRILYPASNLVVLSSHEPPPSLVTQNTPFNTIVEAVDVIRKTVSQHNRSPTFLLHVFGDNGAVQACRLLRSYRDSTHRPLNLGAVVLDTEPPLWIRLQAMFTHVYRSNSDGSSFLSAFVGLISAIWACLVVLARPLHLSFIFSNNKEDRITRSQIRRDLHDSRFVPDEARRCYVLPDDGLVFSWHEEGTRRGDWEVHRDRVDKACRWNSDEERYWFAIEEAWGGGV